MGEKTNNHDHKPSSRFHFGIPVRRSLAFGLLGSVVVFLGSLAWAASDDATQIHLQLVNRQDVAFEPGPIDLEPEPDPNILPRRLDGALVAKNSANLFPVAIMYDNNPSARPPAGLTRASVVYNTLVEGGATRLMAVYSPNEIAGLRLGPVRSAREVYLEWLSEYDGVYVHAGGSPEALQELSGFQLHDLNCLGSGGRYCYRDTSGYAPHNLFTDGDKMSFAIRDFGLTETAPGYHSWRFKDDDALEARGSFTQLQVLYSSFTYDVRYTYDRQNNVYPRFHGSDPHRDRNTGDQVAPHNVIVQVIPPIVSVREKGRLTLNVTGEGKAFLFRDGLVIPGKWVKPLRVERTIFLADDGTEMKLNRGQTFVEVVPEGREFPYQ